MDKRKTPLIEIMEAEAKERKQSRNAIITSIIVFIAMIPIDIWIFDKVTEWKTRQQKEENLPSCPIKNNTELPTQPTEPNEQKSFAQDSDNHNQLIAHASKATEKKKTKNCANRLESDGKTYCIKGDKIIKLTP